MTTPFVIEEGKFVIGSNTNTNNNNTNLLASNQNMKKGNGKSLESLHSNRQVNSLIQFLLDEKDCQYKLQPKTIDDLYEKYVISLVCIYVTLRSKFTKLSNKVIDDKMKSEFPFFIVNNFISHILVHSTIKPLLRRERY
jgi:hypothetical protein